MGTVGWRRGAIGHDRRRSVVACAEGDARNVEFGPGVPIEVFAGGAARLLARGGGVFDLGHRREQAERIGEPARVAGVADRQRTAFEVVGVEQRGSGLAMNGRGQFPAQVHRIFDGGVVTQPAGGRKQVRRVAGQEDRAHRHPLGDQAMPGGPGRPRQDPDRQIRTQGGVEHRGRGRIVDALLLLAGTQLGVKGEFSASVDGHHEGPPFGVEADVHPGRRVRHRAVVVGRLQVHRHHPSTHEVAHDAGFAAIGDAQRLADRAARPVRADQVTRADDGLGSAAGGRDPQGHAGVACLPFAHAPAVVDRHAGKGFGVTPEDRFDEFL